MNKTSLAYASCFAGVMYSVLLAVYMPSIIHVRPEEAFHREQQLIATAKTQDELRSISTQIIERHKISLDMALPTIYIGLFINLFSSVALFVVLKRGNRVNG
jgi:hypothetical protein